MFKASFLPKWQGVPQQSAVLGRFPLLVLNLIRTAVLEKTWPYLNVQTGSKTTGAGSKPGMHMLSLSEIR